VPPLIPALVDEPPSGDGWLHEVNHDGYRTILVVETGQASAFTRNGHNWTKLYWRICETAAKLRCQSAVMDGEMSLAAKARQSQERCPIQFSDHFEGSGADLLTAAHRMGCEGIVSKRAGSRYRSGRSTEWLKNKCLTSSEFIVLGVV
jgi:ATP-dependent DNA ligase